MKMIIGNIKRKNKITFDTDGYPLILASIGASNDQDSVEKEVEKAILKMM